jgi:P4 family phage/plasmid primase-like protien
VIASARTVAAIERLAKADRKHAATHEQWDANPWLLNTPRGIVRLTDGVLLPHDPAQHMTRVAAVTPYGDCPLWLRFLNEITNGDTDLQTYLQRVAGYALTGIVREHAMFFAYGTGGNGKGTFINTIQAILGDYAIVANIETFTETQFSRHLTELARLQGARLVVAQETEEGKYLNKSRITAITGGDPITANFMRQDPFTFLPQFKLFIAGNHKPALRVVDEAIRRRFHMIPFNVRIALAARDHDLADKLRIEWPAILLWMIEGCIAWQQTKLAPPDSVLAATTDYLEAEDVTAAWMEECCRVAPHCGAPSTELFKSWTKWAKAAGEVPGSQKRFSASLTTRGFAPRKSHGTMMFDGISLIIPHAHAEPDEDRA